MFPDKSFSLDAKSICQLFVYSVVIPVKIWLTKKLFRGRKTSIGVPQGHFFFLVAFETSH